MNKERVKDVWDILVSAYKENAIYRPTGHTGNIDDTIDAVLAKGASLQELVDVLAVIAYTKPHDGRLAERDRTWLREYSKTDLGIMSESVDIRRNIDLAEAWRRYIRNVDEIHTTHLSNLVYMLKNRWNKKDKHI